MKVRKLRKAYAACCRRPNIDALFLRHDVRAFKRMSRRPNGFMTLVFRCKRARDQFGAHIIVTGSRKSRRRLMNQSTGRRISSSYFQ